MNQKSVLLLSGASVVMLSPPAIATQPTETIPDLTPAIEADLQTPEPVVVEVQVAPPEQMMEAEQVVEAIAPIAPVPTVSPPEPFAPDFSAPPPVPEATAPTPPERTETVPAIAPISPEYFEEESEPVPVAAEVVSTQPEQSEKLNKSVAAVPEASSTVSPEALPEATEEFEPRESRESREPIEELDELVESAASGAIAPITEFSSQPSDDLTNELTNESLNELPVESDNRLPNVNQSENELPEDSPRLYGEPEAETDLIERLAQDDLDQLSPDEWIDLLLAEEDNQAEENAAENWENPSANLAVPELSHQAEFSQAELKALEQPNLQRDAVLDEVEQSSLQRDAVLDTDPRSPKADAPQLPASNSNTSTNAASTGTVLTGGDHDSDPSFSSTTETAPRYRLVVGDRTIFNVKPYSFNWIPSGNPDLIRKQKLRGRLPAASSTSKTGIRAGIGFNLLISNRAQFQFAHGAQNSNAPKLKTVSFQPATETLSPAQDDYLDDHLTEADVRDDHLIQADKPVRTDKPVEKIELVARTELMEESDSGRAIATSSTSISPSTNAVEEIRVATSKTEKNSVAGEPVYNFNGSFEWRIAPTVVLNAWGGLTVNLLPPDSSILSLTYLFYLGFPDPLDQEGDRLVFMASQPPRSVGSRW